MQYDVLALPPRTAVESDGELYIKISTKGHQEWMPVDGLCDGCRLLFLLRVFSKLSTSDYLSFILTAYYTGRYFLRDYLSSAVPATLTSAGSCQYSINFAGEKCYRLIWLDAFWVICLRL